MTWNDRWETKLFLGGKGTARWNRSEMNNLTRNPVQSSLFNVSPDFEQKVVFYVLSPSCVYSVRPVLSGNF